MALRIKGSSGVTFGENYVQFSELNYSVDSNLTLTVIDNFTVDIFKTSGSNSWDRQAYSLTPFTAPCTIEFNKQAAVSDNSLSYAMIAWNEDPLTNASYTSLDHASYPFQTSAYSVYHNGSQVLSTGSWSTSEKFYIVYNTDGTIKHYNGSNLLYSVSYGTGKTVYVDSSFNRIDSTYGGFSNIKVSRKAWDGYQYTT
jgi:hypothetical protein